VQVLELAAELGLVKVGTVAIDGTKVSANASKHSAVSYGRAGELIERLQGEVNSLLLKAEGADQVPLQDGLSIPQEIKRRQDRQEKLRQARAAVEERARQQAAAQRVEYEAQMARREAKRERGEVVKGRVPKPPSEEPSPKAQYNFTDPESRIMKAGTGEHYEQAYNAQLAVSTESLLIVGQRVSNATNDKQALQPTFESIPAGLGRPERVIVDAGFFSEPQIRGVEGTLREQVGMSDETVAVPSSDEPVAPSTVVYGAVSRISHEHPLSEYEAHPAPVAPAATAPFSEHMQHRISTAEGKAIYKLRKQTVEPVIGIIKEVLGFRRFSLRGAERVSLEWSLVCLAWNLKRLHTLGMRHLLSLKV
jgi:hypothetical protein